MSRSTDLTAALESVQIFAGLPEKSLKRIAEQMRTFEHAAGETVIEEDEGGAIGRMYIVLDGTARAEVDGTEVATYVPGDHFGEMSLLDGRGRSADVVASSESLHLAGLTTWDFRALLKEEPTVAVHVIEVLAGRLRDANERLANPA